MIKNVTNRVTNVTRFFFEKIVLFVIFNIAK